jgi:hypothetical protein
MARNLKTIFTTIFHISPKISIKLKIVIDENQLKLIIVDTNKEVITKWIS